jgi:uncharacterized membrane protein YdbT with pleckstrin-like domain
MPPNTPQPEKTIWAGTSSQWTNIGPFLLCVLIIPIPYAIYRWLSVRCTKFTLTNQRFRIERGILSKRFDEMELYRVKDITMSQPFIQRLVGLGTITMMTSDATTPTVALPAIAEPRQVLDLVRGEVERVRRERNVRELDVYDDDRAALG